MKIITESFSNSYNIGLLQPDTLEHNTFIFEYKYLSIIRKIIPIPIRNDISTHPIMSGIRRIIQPDILKVIYNIHKRRDT